MFAFHMSLAERCEDRLQLEEYDHFENLNSVQCVIEPLVSLWKAFIIKPCQLNFP